MAWRIVAQPVIVVPDDHNMYPAGLVFGNTTTGMGIVPNQWNTIDLRNWGGRLNPATQSEHIPPSGAVSIGLSGELIITYQGAIAPATMDTSICFRAHGMADWMDGRNYVHQCCEAHLFGGQRSTLSVRVPVKDGKFDVFWRVSHPGVAGFGINLVCEELLYDGPIQNLSA